MKPNTQDQNAQQSAHTKLPWHVDNAGDVVTEHETIAIMCGDDGREHAAFIVRACNAHDELVEACRALRRLHYDEGKPTAKGLEAVQMAEAALKKATQP